MGREKENGDKEGEVLRLRKKEMNEEKKRAKVWNEEQRGDKQGREEKKRGIKKKGVDIYERTDVKKATEEEEVKKGNFETKEEWDWNKNKRRIKKREEKKNSRG